MLYHLFYPLKDLWFGFNVFKYITFRACLGSVTAFVMSIILGRFVITWLGSLGIGETLRREHVESLYQLHKHKTGTPTMGGIFIVVSILISTILWARLDNKFMILCLIALIWLALIGFIDDYMKLVHKSRGIQATTKLLGQIILGVIIGVYLYRDSGIPHDLYIPFFKNAISNMGIFYIFFVVLVVVGTSNAVNVTDGLDGLAIGCVSIVALTYSALSYIAGHVKISSYLNVYYLPGASELAVFCAIIFGSALGFLWFNSYPATVFMGDTGSLALGGIIGLVSVLIKKELLLVIVGGIFVIEVLSVLLQIASMKTRGKRIFLMTPLHHHFEHKGWPESKVTVRFLIVGIIFALFSLATLKLQ